jgi:hypothetical protein
VVSFPLAFLPITYTRSSSLEFVPPEFQLATKINFEIINIQVFYIRLLYPSSIQIFPSASKFVHSLNPFYYFRARN